MADNKITIVQGTETIQVVQPSSEIVVTTNQASSVVTVVEKGPKGDKGDSGAAADLNILNSFTGSIQTQVNALIQATASYLLNSNTSSFVTNAQTSSFVVSST